MDAGARAFARFGFHGATLERIAEEAGVSRVTLHRRRVSKDAILGGLVERAVHDYRAAMWPALTQEGSARSRLATALEALCGIAEDHLALLVALRAQSDAVFHEEEPEAMTRSVFTEPLAHLLRSGLTDGSLREVDPDETATVLFNLVGWTYVHLRTGHGWDPARARRSVVAIAMDGIAVAAR